MDYQSPRVSDLGTIRDLTQQGLNKIGTKSDVFSQLTPLVGSVVPAS